MKPERVHRSRGRFLIALPLLCTLLAASTLLWSRYDAARQGGFCPNVTTELERIIADLQGDPKPQDRQWVLNEVMGRINVTRLSASVPGDLREEADLLVELTADHQRAIEVAVAAGAEPPQPSADLASSFLVFAARYANDCVSESIADGLFEDLPAGRPSASLGR